MIQLYKYIPQIKVFHLEIWWSWLIQLFHSSIEKHFIKLGCFEYIKIHFIAFGRSSKLIFFLCRKYRKNSRGQLEKVPFKFKMSIKLFILLWCWIFLLKRQATNVSKLWEIIWVESCATKINSSNAQPINLKYWIAWSAFKYSMWWSGVGNWVMWSTTNYNYYIQAQQKWL